MKLVQIARVLGRRRRLRGREGFTRDQIVAHQQRELERLRAFAVARSPLYRRLHAGLAAAPLQELPILTKPELMAHFDEAVTDPVIRLADIERHVDGLEGDERFLGRYWVSSSSGSSGVRAFVPHDKHEWAEILASYLRASDWGGTRVSPFRRVRVAMVSSRAAYHQSVRVGHTLQSPMIATLRLDAAQPLADIVRALDGWQPEVLVGYASMLRILAEEQLAGRLHIAPRMINSSSEVLTGEARARVRRTWGIEPHEAYAATETGGIAAECVRHAGMHVFEDRVIAEPVDERGRPVPDGTTGARLLVTVLTSRTVPLIRYELTDRVRMATRTCDCGLPFRLLEAIEGRTDDVLLLPAAGRATTVQVHPVLFHQALDRVEAESWQVRQEPGGLRVLVAAPRPGFDADSVRAAVGAALAAAGASRVRIETQVVASIAPAASGKRPLVVALRPQEGAAR
jgi:phenylacetate-CoA ligase